MTPQMFYALRTRFGMTKVQIVEYLGVARRSVQRWESGERAIDEANAATLRSLNDEFQKQLDKAREAVSKGDDEPVVLTILPEAEYLGVAQPDALPYPAYTAVISALACELAAHGREVTVNGGVS